MNAMPDSTSHLPIDIVLPEVDKALAQHPACVLSAPPGAGKTTRVPPYLLKAPWLEGKKIVMLEPRRIAARRAAEFMALQRGEKTGETVGYRIRSEARVGPGTRIEVVTEGILTRMLQSDAGLSGIGLIIFDEFHERSIHADLGLAFALDVQQHLRADLRILVMSATLDVAEVSRLLNGAPVVESQGRIFDIETRYLRIATDKPVEKHVAETVLRALDADEGDILVFLPGRREIRRTEEALYEKRVGNEVAVHLLFGDAPRATQDAALLPDPNGKRKVILSTSVAETSVTIDGVRVVIDSGLARVPRFDPKRGMGGLVTVPVSRAIADQRRGRAGRQASGVCYRLWREEEHAALPAAPQPEIVTADLAPFVLELARWGDPDAAHLRCLDPPPAPNLAQARGLLRSIGALDGSGRLTPHGRLLSEYPVHPRLAHMIVRGKEIGEGSLACELAAMLEERDVLGGAKDADVDLAARWHVLQRSRRGNEGVIERVRTEAARLRKIAGVADRTGDETRIGLLLAFAYPERIAQRREGKGSRYIMVQGTTAILPERSLLHRERYLAIGEVDGAGSEVRVYLAAPLTEEELTRFFSDRFERERRIVWNDSDEAVRGAEEVRLGAIVVDEHRLKLSDEEASPVLLEWIRSNGLGALTWSKPSESLRSRSEWLRSSELAEEVWPDLSDAGLLAMLDTWLLPFLAGVRSRRDVGKLDVLLMLQSLFSRKQLHDLDRLAPQALALPSGSRISLAYEPGKDPVLAVRLQELFGQVETPRVGDGRIPVLVHLLSPAMRPLAVTRDLRSFWTGVYPEIRKQMQARYPKHVWPEDPLSAAPTRKTRRQAH